MRAEQGPLIITVERGDFLRYKVKHVILMHIYTKIDMCGMYLRFQSFLWNVMRAGVFFWLFFASVYSIN